MVFRRKGDKRGTIELKHCKYRGVNQNGRFVIECEVSISDRRIPYKNTKAILLIGEKLMAQNVEVMMESED